MKMVAGNFGHCQWVKSYYSVVFVLFLIAAEVVKSKPCRMCLKLKKIR